MFVYFLYICCLLRVTFCRSCVLFDTPYGCIAFTGQKGYIIEDTHVLYMCWRVCVYVYMTTWGGNDGYVYRYSYHLYRLYIYIMHTPGCRARSIRGISKVHVTCICACHINQADIHFTYNTYSSKEAFLYLHGCQCFFDRRVNTRITCVVRFLKCRMCIHIYDVCI